MSGPQESPRPQAGEDVKHVCDSPSHQGQAAAWVHGITGHAGVFRTFAEARQQG